MHKWNAAIAVICALQGIFLLLLSATKLLPVSIGFLARDPLQSAAAGHTILASGSHHVFDINLVYLLAAAMFAAALAYGLMAWPLRRQYEAEFKRGINRLRWGACALAGGLLLVVVGMLLGVQDAAALLMLFSLGLLAAFCGLATEVYAAGKLKLNWLAYWLAAGIGLAVLVVTGWYLLADSLYGVASGSIWGIFVSLQVLALAFFVNLFLQQRRWGRWAQYAFVDRVYTLLLVVTISALVWQVYAGNLQ